MSELARIATNVPFVLGAIGIGAIALAALFGPQLATVDPQAQRVIIFYPDGSFAAPPTPPDVYYPLGTDPLGRDQVSRLLHGARLTLGATLLGLAGRGLLGLVLGLAAGWRRGPVDAMVLAITNAVGGLPQLMLAVLLAIAFRDLGFAGFVLALALVGWADLAQFVRAETIRVRSTAFVEAARALGARGIHVLRAHVLRALAPQLAGVLALEAGSVLLLLAELGFIGFFISGGTFYIDDAGRPILPVRDRAPEWGQMLAGARQYVFQHQYVALAPGLVVLGAVFAFNLFGEGLRVASDPFGAKRLAPRTLGAIARALGALAILGTIAYGVVTVRSTEISFDDGWREAEAAAARVDPGSRMIAAVVRFSATSHALARPEKINYYFRRPDDTLLRVGFVDADPNAMEVKRFDAEDDLPFASLVPITRPAQEWTAALRSAEERGGGAQRAGMRQWIVVVVLIGEPDLPAIYRVRYARPNGPPQLEFVVDATTGSAAVPALAPQRDAARRAREALGGPVALVAASATWRAPAPAPRGGLGADAPVAAAYTYVRADLPADPRTARISIFLGVPGAIPEVFIATAAIPRPGTIEAVDLERAFAVVEAAGGRDVRLGWERAGTRDWSAAASAALEGGRTVVSVHYSADRQTAVFFRYDPTTDRAERRAAP